MAEVTVDLQGNANDFVKQIDMLTKDMETLNDETKQLNNQTKKGFSESSKAADDFNKKVKDNGKEQKKQVGIIEKINSELKKLKKAREESTSTAGIKKLNKEIDNQERKLKGLIGTTDKVGISFKDIAKGALAFAGIGAALAVVKAGFTKVIKVVGDYDQATSQLKAITGLDDKQFVSFNKAIKEVAGNTQKSAVDVAKAFQLIGSAQPELLKSASALAAVTDSAITLSKAGGLEVPEAANALTKAMNQFGASASDAAKFTDILATSQQKGTATIAQLSESLKNVGAVANAAGVDFEQTNVLLQALAKGGLTGSEAGTGLKTALAKLASQSRDDLNPTLTNTTDIINTLADENLSLVEANKLVGEEGGKALLTLIAQKDVVNGLTGALNEQGNAQAQAATATDNIKDKYDELGNNIDNLILSVEDGSGSFGTFAKVGLDIVNSLFPLMEAGFDFMQEAFSDVGDAIGELVTAFGFVDEAGESTIGVADVIAKSFEAMVIPMKIAINVIVSIIKGLGLLIETGKQVFAFFSGEGFDTGALEDAATSFSDSVIKIGDDAINGTKRLINGVEDLTKKSLSELKTITAKAVADRDSATIKDVKNELERRRNAKQDELDIEIEGAAEALEVNKKLSDDKRKANEKAAQERIKQLEKIEAEFLKALEKLTTDSDKIILDGLEGKERFAKIKENQLAEIQLLENTIKEKGQLLADENGEVFELTENQIDQLEILRNEARTNELSAIAKFNAEKKLAAIDAGNDALDIQEQFSLESVDDLSIDDSGLSEVDFLLFQEEEKLRIQEEFALKRIDLLQEEIDAKIEILGADGEIDAAEQNQIDTLELQKQKTQDAVEDFRNEREKLAAERGKFNMAEFLGVSKEGLSQVKDNLNLLTEAVVDQIGSILEAQAEAAEARIEFLEGEIDDKRDALDQELELNKQGFASNVDGKRAELAALEEEKKKAQKTAEETAKKQFVLDTAIQASSIITASANVLKGFSTIPLVGQILGIAAIATMIGGFVASRVAARQQIKAGKVSLEKGGSGDNSGMFKGKRHSEGGIKFLDRVEVEDGEKWSVFNRNTSKKHGKFIDEMSFGLNKGKDPTDLMADLLHGTGIYMKKDTDQKIENREVTIRKEQIMLTADLTSNKMVDVMSNVDRNLEQFMNQEKGRKQIIPTSWGRIEIEDGKETIIRMKNLNSNE